jgi:hypothetical protein
MSVTCHRCGAVDPAGNIFRSERLPFRGARIYCPKCHAKYEDNFFLGMLAVIAAMGLAGLVFLWTDSTSKVGHVWANLFLVQFIILPSVVIHEFAHAIVGRLCGLTVLKIWIGRGKAILRTKFFGFDTEFKIIPVGGLTFLTHGLTNKLRMRYFCTILAGPLINVIILAFAWKYVTWQNFNLENTIQFAAFVAFAQIFILVENLLPYRIQTAFGRLSTDGLSILQLLAGKAPDFLVSTLRVDVNPQQGTFTR